MSHDWLDSKKAIVPQLGDRSLQALSATQQLTIAHDLASDIERKCFLKLLLEVSEPPALLSLICKKCSSPDVLEKFFDLVCSLDDAPEDWLMELDYFILQFGAYQWPSFEILSDNENLPSSLEFVERYENRWNWGKLSSNENLPWSIKLIERYGDCWNWGTLSCNQSVPWSSDLIERYKERWFWDELSGNESLPWSLELIERYEERWDWHRLSGSQSVPWSSDLIERYKERWFWDELSGNESVPWSLELIERYEDWWNWGCHERSWNSLSNNESLPWSSALIERYKERWFWDELSGNESLPWSSELIERYEDRWNWNGYGYYDLQEMHGLSSNKSLPWSLELIKRYEEQWDWRVLLNNKFLTWSIEIIDGLLSSSDFFKHSTISHLHGDFDFFLDETAILELAPSWELLKHNDFFILECRISKWLSDEMEQHE